MFKKESSSPEFLPRRQAQGDRENGTELRGPVIGILYSVIGNETREAQGSGLAGQAGHASHASLASHSGHASLSGHSAL